MLISFVGVEGEKALGVVGVVGAAVGGGRLGVERAAQGLKLLVELAVRLLIEVAQVGDGRGRERVEQIGGGRRGRRRGCRRCATRRRLGRVACGGGGGTAFHMFELFALRGDYCSRWSC